MVAEPLRGGAGAILQRWPPLPGCGACCCSLLLHVRGVVWGSPQFCPLSRSFFCSGGTPEVGAGSPVQLGSSAGSLFQQWDLE